MENNQTSTKHSRQREIVKNDILNRYDHPTAEAVYLTVRVLEPKISLATVYRNLDYFVDEGLVEKFMVPNEPDHYDPVSYEHYHVKCNNCGEISDVNIQLSDYFARQVKSQTEISVKTLQIIAEGICESCKSQSNSNMKGEL